MQNKFGDRDPEAKWGPGSKSAAHRSPQSELTWKADLPSGGFGGSWSLAEARVGIPQQGVPCLSVATPAASRASTRSAPRMLLPRWRRAVVLGSLGS